MCSSQVCGSCIGRPQCACSWCQRHRQTARCGPLRLPRMDHFRITSFPQMQPWWVFCMSRLRPTRAKVAKYGTRVSLFSSLYLFAYVFSYIKRVLAACGPGHAAKTSWDTASSISLASGACFAGSRSTLLLRPSAAFLIPTPS